MNKFQEILEKIGFVDHSPVKEMIPELYDENRDQSNDPLREYSLYPSESIRHRILLGVHNGGTVKHRSRQNEEKINRKITTLKYGNNIVEVP